MAKKLKKKTIKTMSDNEEFVDVKLSLDATEKKEEVVDKPLKTVKELTPTSKASAEIVEKAVKATTEKNIQVSKPINIVAKKEVVAKPVEEEKVEEAKPVSSMYDLYLGRYCKLVSQHMNNETTKRPIGAFINLMEYVVRSSSNSIYADMLKFFTLEVNGIMSNSNALNGIETINDPVIKTRAMTLFTVFNGLAMLRSTGRRPSFSINAIRAVVKHDKFTNWVNLVLNA